MKKVYYSNDFCAESKDVALIVANDEAEARELLKPHITTKKEPSLHRVSRAEIGVTILKDQ